MFQFFNIGATDLQKFWVSKDLIIIVIVLIMWIIVSSWCYSVTWRRPSNPTLSFSHCILSSWKYYHHCGQCSAKNIDASHHHFCIKSPAADIDESAKEDRRLIRCCRRWWIRLMQFLAALAALYLTSVTGSLGATLEFWHKEWLLRLQTLQTFDQHDVQTKRQKDKKTKRQKDERRKKIK